MPGNTDRSTRLTQEFARLLTAGLLFNKTAIPIYRMEMFGRRRSCIELAFGAAK